MKVILSKKKFVHSRDPGEDALLFMNFHRTFRRSFVRVVASDGLTHPFALSSRPRIFMPRDPDRAVILEDISLYMRVAGRAENETG
jgi:hypothetical protein